MHSYRDRTFIDERIHVNGKVFIDCVFDGCVLVLEYKPQDAGFFGNINFIECRFEGAWPMGLVSRNKVERVARRSEPEVLMPRGARHVLRHYRRPKLPHISDFPFWKNFCNPPGKKA